MIERPSLKQTPVAAKVDARAPRIRHLSQVPFAELPAESFQVVNYMRPEPGAVKDARVQIAPAKHLYFRSAFIMNHTRGYWKFAQRELQRLNPRDEVRAL